MPGWSKLPTLLVFHTPRLSRNPANAQHLLVDHCRLPLCVYVQATKRADTTSVFRPRGNHRLLIVSSTFHFPVSDYQFQQACTMDLYCSSKYTITLASISTITNITLTNQEVMSSSGNEKASTEWEVTQANEMTGSSTGIKREISTPPRLQFSLQVLMEKKFSRFLALPVCWAGILARRILHLCTPGTKNGTWKNH